MRKLSFLFTFLKVPFDFFMILGAALTAHFLRFQVPFITELRPASQLIPFQEYMAWAFLGALGLVALFALLRLYSPSAKRRFFDELFGVINGCSLGLALAVLVMFFSRALLASRFIILMLWVLSIIFIMAGRVLLRALRRVMFKKGKGLEQVVIIGKGKNALMLAREIGQNPHHGFKLLGQFEIFSDIVAQELLALRKRACLDAVWAVDPEHTPSEIGALLEFTDHEHIALKYGADFFVTHTPRLTVETFVGVPMVEVKRTSLEGWGRVVKRVFDIVGSLVLIILTSLPMLIAALAIKLTNWRAPILFSRRDDNKPVLRVGQYGKPFWYFKFRSMRPKTDSLRYTELNDLNFRQGPLVKIKNDPRVTPVGRFIRRFSLDELPEFFLVLWGKMSLVGPRPHLPEEVAKYKKEYKRLFLVKPGITGMAQISGRSDLDFDEEARLDLTYIENWSLLYDVIILLKTPWVVLRGVRG